MRRTPRSTEHGPPSSGALVIAGLVALGDALGITLVLLGQQVAGLAVVFLTLVLTSRLNYASLRRRHGHMVILDEFAAGIGAAVVEGDPTMALLTRIREIFGADWAWLITADDTMASTIAFDGHDLERGLAQQADLDLVAQLAELSDRGASPLLVDPVVEYHGDRRVRHIIAATLPVSMGGVTVLAVGRHHRLEPFRTAQVTLFSRLALHGGVAIQNTRLLDRLRVESASNRHQADHDSLTGLANRNRFRERVAESMVDGRRPGVLLIDLDRFKEVNDTLGHHNGDLLLAEAAVRMREVVGGRVLLARLGGDEFGALVDANPDEMSMQLLANNLRTAMTKPFRLGQVQADVGASVGIAIARDAGEDVGDLLRRADVAMYAAKTDRTGVEMYRGVLDQHSTERLELVPRLRSAIERGELTLHFQPQLDLRSGRVVGAETLIRWPVVGVGFISPDDFLPAAEQTDLIRPLTRFVLEAAIAQCARWRAAGHGLRVSVNLSARNLLEPDLAAHISGLVARAGLPRDALRVELTETAVVTRADETARALQSLRSNGIGVALDDFGTGHSSLTHLTTLPVDEVKIDKSFVLQLGTDPIAARVVRTVVELGNNLGLDVVAEGVETAYHADELMKMGCGHAQGYFFARPMTATDFERWLAEHRRWTAPSLTAPTFR